MTTVPTAIPDNLSLQAGENIHLAAQVQADGSFLVTRVVRQSQPEPIKGARVSLSEWVRKYAGTMKLAEEESRESLRDSYLAEKFGH
jgi:antitoxin component of MazEF toxin-antitoxin module